MSTDYSDELTSIIKSIESVKFVFSKKSKDLDRYFIYKNLDNFVKTFDKTDRSKSAFFPLSPKNNNKYIYENDIQKTFKLLEKIKTTNKYLPKSLREKNQQKLIKNNSENNIKNMENKSFTRMLNNIQPPENFFDRITLDPGRYNPKYNLRFKRIINTYFKYPKINLKKTELNNEKENENVISKYEYKRVKSFNKNKNKKEFNKTYSKEKKGKYSLLKNYINQSSSQINININLVPNTKNINPKEHINSFNKTSSQPLNININSKALTPKNEKITLKKYYNKKIFSATNKKHNFNLENKNEKEEKDEINKFGSSIGFQKNIISFDKIRGRKKNLFEVREEIKTTYVPKYETIRPKMRIKEFNLRKSLRSFKKYAVGKIIRNYHCTPNYFIFDINQNKNIERDYRYIFEKKY